MIHSSFMGRWQKGTIFGFMWFLGILVIRSSSGRDAMIPLLPPLDVHFNLIATIVYPSIQI